MTGAFALLLVVAMLFAGAAAGQPAAADSLSDLAFQPHPGGTLPLAATMTDAQGEKVQLGRFFAGEPVVLVLEYLRCKTLCGLTLEHVVAALDALPLAAGRDFRMLAISIDPRDGPSELARAEAKYLAGYHHPSAATGIHFLAGSAETVRRIADAVGFPYRYDPETDQYLHPAGFIVAAADGRISRYIFGFGFAASDLGNALGNAAQGRTAGPLTRLLLLCHIQGAPLGRFTVPVLAAFTVADLAAMVFLVVMFAALRRRRDS